MLHHDLRPLTLGELLDRSFSIYRANFLMLFLIALIPGLTAIPAALVQFDPKRGLPDVTQMVTMGALFLGSAILAAVLGILSQAATTFAVSEIYQGRTATVGESFNRVKGSLWTLFNVSLSIGLRLLLVVLLPIVAVVALLRSSPILAVLAGFVLGGTALVVCVLIVLWYTFGVQVVLFEGVKASLALTRSKLLTEGFRGQIFLTLLLMFLLSFLIGLVFGVPMTIYMVTFALKGATPPTWLILLNGLGSALARGFAGPPAMIAITLLYYNSRVVKEGYDLQVLLDRLGPETPPLAPDAV